MGPGTDIVGRLERGVRPTTHIDEVAMYHDIDYTTDKEPIVSDLMAILQTYRIHNISEFIQAAAMRVGLTARSLLDAMMHLLPIENPTHINKVINNDKLYDMAQQLTPYS